MVMAIQHLMGGVTVVFSGDFRQTLPVIPRETQANELSFEILGAVETCQIFKTFYKCEGTFTWGFSVKTIS